MEREFSVARENPRLLREQNGKAMADSLGVAQHFDKQHKDVLRSIENLECSPEFGRRNFAPTSYTDSWNREQKMILMTRDGFSFLAMGFTGRAAARWKEKYIAAFNEIEAKLRSKAEQGSLAETERELLGMYREHLRLLRSSKKRGSKLSAGEKRQIWQLTLAGYSHHYIAQKLGRDASNIRRWQKLYLELAEAKYQEYQQLQEVNHE